MRILFAVAECLPFIKTGGLADVAGALPGRLARLGHEVKIILPGYSAIPREKYGFKPCGGPFTVNHMGSDVEIGLMESGRIRGVQTLLVCQDSLFARGALYGEPDDQHRFIIFCKAVMAYMFNNNYYPDVVHCHDWHTALLPVYLKTAAEYNPDYRRTAGVFTIHNLGYQGKFGPEALQDAGLDRSLFNMNALEHYGQTNFMKGAIAFADKITTVSPTYAREILTPEFGEGLEGILRTREKDTRGIINGLDYDLWDTSRDPNIAARYSMYRPAGKAVCKRELLRELGLEGGGMVCGIVSRLCKQKGIDVLMPAVRDLLAHSDVKLIIQGTGDREYEAMADELCRDFPGSARHIAKYSEAMARRVYAGSDMFLMPSLYEPCGLGQMIAMACGALPFVHKTGGLADTVFDADYAPEGSVPNGFAFEPLSANAVKDNLWRAYFIYRNDPERWNRLRSSAFRCRFSWDRSVKEYLSLYAECAKRP